MKKYRFNIFDASIILLVIIFTFIYARAYAQPPEENGAVYYTLSVSDVDEHVAASFKAECDIYNESGNIIGKARDIEITPKTNTFKDSRGNSDTVEYDGVYTVKIKAVSPATLSKSSITANGEMIATGRKISFTSNGVSAVGVCSEIEFLYYDGGNEQ